MDASSVDATTVVAIAREIAHRPPAVIVAVGGGSVLDAGKIAALAAARGRLLDYTLGHASSAALTFVPDAPPPVDIVAVPTTLGTSSETNSVGILKNEHGHRLIVGRALTPRHAVLDPCALATLAPLAVGEGVMEAFLRLAGASTSPRRSIRQHTDAVALGRALLESATRDTSSAAGRLRLARLSAATQRTAALRGPDPYSARHWYAANEVASHLEVRKMVATATVIAAVWRRICAGDVRWGDRDSLELFWRSVACGMAAPLDPPSGIATLIERWGIPRAPRPTASEIDRIAEAMERAWGDRHPMLPGLVADDFGDLLRDSDWSPRPVGGDRRPSMNLRGGETNEHEG
ncbi:MULTISPECIES: daptide-type RiPP biosynthesis dehydogenase [unclassified Microbacterium]|uniref:daptide-type RiPP biosynthesis dehydogenase n=1 Tax=unclassified Microbacterium TaxID=2609290 RepID=UPI00160510ED|nr:MULTISPECIES: daptide-type RiPP biosynthesis dehydogenase [unclassified Microbacterium]QNA93336.1 iron-containing alcohol dehydrogenase [Microbacterium sp. Se63.02b]